MSDAVKNLKHEERVAQGSVWLLLSDSQFAPGFPVNKARMETLSVFRDTLW